MYASFQRVPSLQLNQSSCGGLSGKAAGAQTRKLGRPPRPMVRHSSDLLWRISALNSKSGKASGGFVQKSGDCGASVAAVAGTMKRSSSRHSFTESAAPNAILNIDETPEALG